jgi:hypothetical protein
MEPVPVDLSGVPATLPWNLGRRAAAARTGASRLEDPLAIELAGRLQYDFTDASQGARWHAVRVATFDDAVRRFLGQHPAGTVVALGEGLETQFWRLDNGQSEALSQMNIPDGETAVSAGFWIFDNSLAALETPTASIEVTRPQEIEMYARMFGHLKSAALYGRAARALITNTITELSRRNLSQHHGLPASRFLTSQTWTTPSRRPTRTQPRSSRPNARHASYGGTSPATRSARLPARRRGTPRAQGVGPGPVPGDHEGPARTAGGPSRWARAVAPA